jgi:hypothetical protein
MWQATLLKLYDLHERNDATKNALLLHIRHDLIDFGLENARHDVRAVLGLLPRQKRIADLRPLRIACDGYEEIRFSMGAHDRHCVLVPAVHVSRPAGE